MYQKQYPGPNTEVEEALARVCTGPHQTRPLGARADDPIKPSAILEIILRSVKGELPENQAVSEAQMGAFFAGMTIRKGFPKKTQWSEAEIAAFDKYRSGFRATYVSRDQVYYATGVGVYRHKSR